MLANCAEISKVTSGGGITALVFVYENTTMKN